MCCAPHSKALALQTPRATNNNPTTAGGALCCFWLLLSAGSYGSHVRIVIRTRWGRQHSWYDNATQLLILHILEVAYSAVQLEIIPSMLLPFFEERTVAVKSKKRVK